MNLLKFLGAALYSIVFSHIVWVVFHFLTPWIMGYAWTAVIVFLVLGTSIIGGFIALCSVLLSPLTKLINNTASKIIPTLAMLFYGYSTIMLPWRLDMEYSAVKIILGGLISIDALILFGAILYFIWVGDNDAKS